MIPRLPSSKKTSIHSRQALFVARQAFLEGQLEKYTLTPTGQPSTFNKAAQMFNLELPILEKIRKDLMALRDNIRAMHEQNERQANRVSALRDVGNGLYAVHGPGLEFNTLAQVDADLGRMLEGDGDVVSDSEMGGMVVKEEDFDD